MYSVVLMMALTSGGDAPAWGRGCSGCYGGCFGCYGGYSCGGSCHGRKHGCCGCSGGCWGGGSGGCHGRKHGCCGCHGGYYGGCYGGGCYGGACFGGACSGGACFGGGYGGTVAPVVPAAPVTPAPAPATTPKKTSLEGAAPATLIVNVPAEARLSIDGEATTSTATQRVFVSPALNFGREYHYTLEAEFQKDGKMVKVTKEVAVKAGDETRVNFDAEVSAEIASR